MCTVSARLDPVSSALSQFFEDDLLDDSLTVQLLLRGRRSGRPLDTVQIGIDRVITLLRRGVAG